MRTTSEAIFISKASIFLPRYSGVRPTISPAMNTATIDEHQHAVEPGADAAEDHLAELHEQQRDQAAERRERVVHRVDRAVGGGGGRRRPERRVARCRSGPPCPPCCRRAAAPWRPGRRRACASSGLPACSAAVQTSTSTARTASVMAASSAQPWRRSPTIWPNV